MLAAAVTGALSHVRQELPTGAIAIDTSNVGSRNLIRGIATRLHFEVGGITDLIRCDRITGECLLRDAAGPAVIIALRPPEAGFTVEARREFPTLEVDVHWRRGAADSRQLSGRIIEVRLDWTREAGWIAFETRTAWRLH